MTLTDLTDRQREALVALSMLSSPNDERYIEASRVGSEIFSTASEERQSEMRYRSTSAGIGRTLSLLSSRGLVEREWAPWYATWTYRISPAGSALVDEIL